MENRIRSLREDMDLRQVDVAEKTGIDQKTLSNYETGKTNPDSYALVRLANFFDVSIDYLVGRTDNKINSKRDVLFIVEEIEKKLKDIKEFINRDGK